MDRYTVYARYLLIFVAARLISTQNLPEPIALIVREMAMDPTLVSDVAGGLSLATALVWYHFSKARKALKEALT